MSSMSAFDIIYKIYFMHNLLLYFQIEARPMGTEMWVLQTVIQVIRPIEKVQLSPPDEGFSDVRVKLCLESNDSWCGDAKLANPQDGMQ